MVRQLIIENGHIIDPDSQLDQQSKLFIKDGLFVTEEEIDASVETEYIDAQGSYVSPGFIDMHVHVFKEYTSLGIEADLVGVEQGVTTIVDAGSSGYDDYPTFKKLVIEPSKTEVLSFLNISRKGLSHGLSELANLEDLMTAEEWQQIHRQEPSIIGLKARLSRSVVKESGIKPLEHVQTLVQASDAPLMVHIGNPPPNLIEIFPLLRKGDIVTHAFHGKVHGVLDKEGNLIPEALNGLKRGVLFDVGHGTESFSYNTMKKFKQQYEYAFTISTDLYLKNYDTPVGSLMATMAKVMSLGYTLEQVVESVTSRSARALGLTEQGTFKIGTRADITIFKIENKRSVLTDSEGVTRECPIMLEPFMTIREGKVVFSHEF